MSDIWLLRLNPKTALPVAAAEYDPEELTVTPLAAVAAIGVERTERTPIRYPLSTLDRALLGLQHPRQMAGRRGARATGRRHDHPLPDKTTHLNPLPLNLEYIEERRRGRADEATTPSTATHGRGRSAQHGASENLAWTPNAHADRPREQALTGPMRDINSAS